MDMHIRELSGCDLPDDFWPESGVPDCIVKKISKESGVAEKHVRACLLFAFFFPFSFFLLFLSLISFKKILLVVQTSNFFQKMHDL